MSDQDFPADDATPGDVAADIPPDIPGTAPDDAAPGDELDLAAIESELNDVQAALARLADGSYWTDEVTGEPIPADVLASNPLARHS